MAIPIYTVLPYCVIMQAVPMYITMQGLVKEVILKEHSNSGLCK